MGLIAFALVALHALAAARFLPHFFAHMVWFSGGIAISALLLKGVKLWPAIFLGALSGGLLVSVAPASAFFAATALTLAAIFATWMVGQLMPHFDQRIRCQKDLWSLFFACLLQALVSAALLLIFGFLSGSVIISPQNSGFLDLSVAFFIGSALLAPLILMMATRGIDNFMLLQRPLEFALFISTAIIVNWVVWITWDVGFHTMTGTWYLAPVFIWAVARMGQRGTAILVLLTYGFATGSAHGSDLADIWHVTNDWDVSMFGVMLALCSHLAAAIFNEQLLAENAVLESKRRLRLGQLYGGVGSWEADLISGRQYWSDYVVQQLGFPRIENPTWEDFISIVVPEDRARVNEAVRAHLEHGAKYDTRYRIADVYGRVRTLRCAGQVERDEEGTPVVMRGILQDISDIIFLEESLNASEQRYHSLFQGTGDPIVLADFSGYIEDINRSAEKLLGYRRSEVMGRHVCTIHPYTQLQRVQAHFMQMTACGSADALETQILQKDGNIIDVEVRPTMLEISGRKLLQSIFIDLTERKCLEAQRLAEEAAHRNTLVREVHHRIKNNLQGIVGVLRQFAGSYPHVAHPINEAISQVQSIAIIHGLQGRSARDKVRVCELTSTIAAGVGALWQFPVEVDIPAAWTPCTITEKEAVPLALVLNELLSNAVKHSEGGEVGVSIRHEPRPDAIALTIRNSGHMQSVAAIQKSSTSSSGIDLVRSLLPRTGANLSWRQEGVLVVTELLLEPPIVSLDEEGEFVAYEF